MSPSPGKDASMGSIHEDGTISRNHPEYYWTRFGDSHIQKNAVEYFRPDEREQMPRLIDSECRI